MMPYLRILTCVLMMSSLIELSQAQVQDSSCPPGPFSCVGPGPVVGPDPLPNPPPPFPFLEVDPKFVNAGEIVNQFLLASENSVTILEVPKEGLLSPELMERFKAENFKRDSFYLVPNEFVEKPYRLNQYVIMRGKDMQ